MENLSNFFELCDQVAIVTGAGSGIGQAIAAGYARQGARIAVVDLNKENAAVVAGEIIESGGKALPLECDVSKTNDAVWVVSEVMNHFGQIDILVNNAGIGDRAMAEEMTDDMWDKVLAINLKGAFLFCREAGREMIKRGKGGRIINMASIAGLVGLDTGNANYCASKGGLIALTRCLAIEWAKYGILVNAIAPSHVRTPLIANLMKEKPEVEAGFLDNIPLGRIGEPDDVVGPAVFLASPAASFITGHTLIVDGGHTAR